MKMNLLGIKRYHSEQGISMLEYAVAAAALLGSVAAAMALLGDGFQDMFGNIRSYATQQTSTMGQDSSTN